MLLGKSCPLVVVLFCDRASGQVDENKSESRKVFQQR
jgi:hypothetical protein